MALNYYWNLFGDGQGSCFYILHMNGGVCVHQFSWKACYKDAEADKTLSPAIHVAATLRTTYLSGVADRRTIFRGKDILQYLCPLLAG